MSNIDLIRFIAEKSKNVDTPMNIARICKDFKEKIGCADAPIALSNRIRALRNRIHEIQEFDNDTKVRMLFSLSAQVDSLFLNELRNEADVELDNRRRIVRYEKRGGGLSLSGEYPNQNSQFYADRDRKLLEFLAEKSRVDHSPMTDTAIEREFQIWMGFPEESMDSRNRVRIVKNKIYAATQFDKQTKIKMLILSSVKVDEKVLKELRLDATVETDQEHRITSYLSNDGSLDLEGDHSTSAKKKRRSNGMEEPKDELEQVTKSGRISKMRYSSSMLFRDIDDSNDNDLSTSSSETPQILWTSTSNSVQSTSLSATSITSSRTLKREIGATSSFSSSTSEDALPPFPKIPRHPMWTPLPRVIKNEPKRRFSPIRLDEGPNFESDPYDGIEDGPGPAPPPPVRAPVQASIPNFGQIPAQLPAQHTDLGPIPAQIPIQLPTTPHQNTLEEPINCSVQSERNAFDDVDFETSLLESDADFLRRIKKEQNEPDVICDTVFVPLRLNSNSTMTVGISDVPIERRVPNGTTSQPPQIEQKSARVLLSWLSNLITSLDKAPLKEIQKKIDKLIENLGNRDEKIPIDTVLSTLSTCLHIVMKNSVPKSENSVEESISLKEFLLTLQITLSISLKSSAVENFLLKIKENIKELGLRDKIVPIESIRPTLENVLLVIS